MMIMARARSDKKRSDLLAAATRVIADHGISASTSMIAKEADVATGSLFTYFKNKGDLFNELFLDLKSNLATAAMEGFPEGATLRGQLSVVWTNWMGWAVANPEKRCALAQLSVSGTITPETHAAQMSSTSALAELMDRARNNGSLRTASNELAAALMNSIAEVTMDLMVREPENAPEHSQAGFEALWRVLN
jgi:AcrR family transcriptional regulator